MKSFPQDKLSEITDVVDKSVAEVAGKELAVTVIIWEADGQASIMTTGDLDLTFQNMKALALSHEREQQDTPRCRLN